jgi:WD40 repeat protein
VWSLETLGRVKTLTGHTDAVRALAVSNGRLFSGSYDGSVKVCFAALPVAPPPITRSIQLQAPLCS